MVQPTTAENKTGANTFGFSAANLRPLVGAYTLAVATTKFPVSTLNSLVSTFSFLVSTLTALVFTYNLPVSTFKVLVSTCKLPVYTGKPISPNKFFKPIHL